MTQTEIIKPAEQIIEDNYGLYLLKSIIIVAIIVFVSALITYFIN